MSFLILIFAVFIGDTFELSFVDETKNPIAVTICECYSEPAAGLEQPPYLLRETDQTGKIRVNCNDPKKIDGCCFVYSKGHAIDLLGTQSKRSRSLRVQLALEEVIQVSVVDQKGNPVPGARVTPGAMNFRESGWTANVPYRLPDFLESLSDATGIAKIHGAKKDTLQSVRIALGSERGGLYQIPKTWDGKKTLRIVLRQCACLLRCKALDDKGQPVSGARLYAGPSEDSVNQIKTPTLVFSEYLGQTNAHGVLDILDVPEGVWNIRLFSPEPSMGWGEYRLNVIVSADRINDVLFKSKPTKEVAVSVVDLSGSGQAGVRVTLMHREKGEYVDAFATSNEDGIAVAELQVGEWLLMVDELSLPVGFHLYKTDVFPKMLVNEDSTIQMGTPIFIAQGRILEGVVRGIDLSVLRSDWIHLTAKEQVWMGRFENDGTFRIAIPNSLRDDEIAGFQMGHGTRDGSFKIVSRAPWEIHWTANNSP